MAKPQTEVPISFRTIWISDFHLGTRNCRPQCLLDFLRHHESEYLYLVGDVVDGWRLKKLWHWDQFHNDVFQKLLRKARKGARVMYIPGNHDAFARSYVGLQFGGIFVMDRTIHTTVDGRRLLVLHGDEFDSVVTHSRWLAALGSSAYEFSLHLNRWFNLVRSAMGYPYWSLSAYLKHRVKNAVAVMDNFEHALAMEARMARVDGVVCGHIHHAAMRTVEGVTYYNCGDWVESCTALVEHYDGSMEIITWPFARESAEAESSAAGFASETPTMISDDS